MKLPIVHLTGPSKPTGSDAPVLYAWKCGIAYYMSPQADPYKATCKKCLKKIATEEDSSREP